MKSIKKEIITLFIKRNTKFTHISIPYKFDFQLHLIPKAKDHFSDIKFLSCSTCVNNNILIGIMKICKSIEELELIVEYIKINKSPFTKILTSFINLQVLELDNIQNTTLDYLENLSLPYLRILRTKSVSIEVSTILIKSTGGFLNEIKIDSTFGNVYSNNRIIQAIYNNCPFLKYLKLILLNDNISELEKLIINCNYLNGLFIIIDSLAAFDWDNLFKILTESSPNSKHPMLLQLSRVKNVEDLIVKYKKKGRVKIYNNNVNFDEGFEWI
ncbi:19695_t:CDS:2 [Rhizophagus irregularis]|nr:19695_t:CDS:2 [Rhizophagus irregularis]